MLDCSEPEAMSTVRLERSGTLAILILDRPAKKNALNEALWLELERRLEQLEAKLPRAVVITGAGDAFCAGVDVNPDNPLSAAMLQAMQDRRRESALAVLTTMRRIVDRLVELPVPVIAAINGLAYGGGAEIAARLDLRVIDPQATICFSEVRLGLMPDLGGGVALTRLLGPGLASDLILTARRLDAQEALRLGLVNRVSAPGKSVELALELAGAIANNGPRAVRSALEVIRRSSDLPIGDALSFELERAADLIVSGECVHGISALFSKQEPEFPEID
jgi:enoyl-CoA hydratase/carnithine racemase